MNYFSIPEINHTKREETQKNTERVPQYFGKTQQLGKIGKA